MQGGAVNSALLQSTDAWNEKAPHPTIPSDIQYVRQQSPNSNLGETCQKKPIKKTLRKPC